MCDKGLFASFVLTAPYPAEKSADPQRLELFQKLDRSPLGPSVRKNQAGRSGLVTLASGRLTNEIYILRKLTETQGGTFIGYSRRLRRIVNRFAMLPAATWRLGKGFSHCCGFQ
jgi:hypothetical protein